MPISVEVVGGDACPECEIIVTVVCKHIDTLLADDNSHLVTEAGERIRVS